MPAPGCSCPQADSKRERKEPRPRFPEHRPRGSRCLAAWGLKPGEQRRPRLHPVAVRRNPGPACLSPCAGAGHAGAQHPPNSSSSCGEQHRRERAAAGGGVRAPGREESAWMLLLCQQKPAALSLARRLASSLAMLQRGESPEPHVRGGSPLHSQLGDCQAPPRPRQGPRGISAPRGKAPACPPPPRGLQNAAASGADPSRAASLVPVPPAQAAGGSAGSLLFWAEATAGFAKGGRQRLEQLPAHEGAEPLGAFEERALQGGSCNAGAAQACQPAPALMYQKSIWEPLGGGGGGGEAAPCQARASSSGTHQPHAPRSRYWSSNAAPPRRARPGASSSS